MTNHIIAVDGTTASGKGTVSKKLAAYFKFDYLDTGLLYRKVAFLYINKGLDLSDPQLIASSVIHSELSEELLRTQEISECASKVASMQSVRCALLEAQQTFPIGKKGVVIDGRDIGTEIFPNAATKFFITASKEVRATRRYNQLLSLGSNQDLRYEDILEEIHQRDLRDSMRAISPLHPAEDAIYVETSNLSADNVFNLCIRLCRVEIV